MRKHSAKLSLLRFFHSSIYHYSIKYKAVLLLIVKITLLAFILFNTFQAVSQVNTKYTSRNYWQRYPALEKLYYNSIYRNKHGVWIPDETVYAFAGGALIRGGNPILVNPEVPPFGKYLIGLSVLFFNNENIINLIVVASSLTVLFLLGKKIFSSTLLALIAPAALSSEPVFLNQLLFTPLLDILQLLFLLLCFYFFNKALTGKKHTFLFFLISAVFVGFIISTKFFGVGAPIIAALFAVLLYNKDLKKIIKLTLTLPIPIIILLSSYFRVLQFGYSIRKFLGIQHWVYWYNSGHVHTLLSVWPLILINKWYILWSQPPISDPEWRITWPLLVILSILTALAYLLKLIPPKKEIEIFISWVIFYLAFLSIGNASARYFVILIPIMYLVVVFGLYYFVKGIFNRSLRKSFIVSPLYKRYRMLRK